MPILLQRQIFLFCLPLYGDLATLRPKYIWKNKITKCSFMFILNKTITRTFYFLNTYLPIYLNYGLHFTIDYSLFIPKNNKPYLDPHIFSFLLPVADVWRRRRFDCVCHLSVDVQPSGRWCPWCRKVNQHFYGAVTKGFFTFLCNWHLRSWCNKYGIGLEASLPWSIAPRFIKARLIC